MRDIIEILAAVGLLFGAYGLVLCYTNRPKKPKAGKDFDERGPLD